MIREVALSAFLLFSPDEHGVKILMVLMFRYPSTDSAERIKKKIERILYQSLKTKQLPFTINKPSFTLTCKSFYHLCDSLVFLSTFHKNLGQYLLPF